jgi:hypothetical protein
MIKLNGGESILSNELTKGLLTSIPHGLYPMDETGQELVIGNQLRSFNNNNIHSEIKVPTTVLSEEETIARVDKYIKKARLNLMMIIFIYIKLLIKIWLI